MKAAFFLILVLGLFAGCSEKKPVVVEQEKIVPEWVANPPRTDEHFLYALGEGESKAEALNDALQRMLSTLSISVSSSYRSSISATEVNGKEDYVKKTDQEINARVKELRIPNYVVLQESKMGFHSYALLIRSDKKLFFTSLQNELLTELKLLEDKKTALKNTDILKQLTFYKHALRQLELLRYKAEILKVLNSSFDTTFVTVKSAQFQNEYALLQKRLSFVVKGDKEIVPVVKEELSKKGYKIVSKADTNSLHVDVRSQTNYSFAYGFHIAKSDIFIDVKDAQKSELVAKNIHINGQSTLSQKDASANRAVKLKEYFLKPSNALLE